MTPNQQKQRILSYTLFRLIGGRVNLSFGDWLALVDPKVSVELELAEDNKDFKLALAMNQYIDAAYNLENQLRKELARMKEHTQSLKSPNTPDTK